MAQFPSNPNYVQIYDGTDGDGAPPLQWKVVVVDETSRKLIDNAVSEDDILNLNVTSRSTSSGVLCDIS